jgi:hypothetical protein
MSDVQQAVREKFGADQAQRNRATTGLKQRLQWQSWENVG